MLLRLRHHRHPAPAVLAPVYVLVIHTSCYFYNITAFFTSHFSLPQSFLASPLQPPSAPFCPQRSLCIHISHKFQDRQNLQSNTECRRPSSAIVRATTRLPEVQAACYRSTSELDIEQHPVPPSFQPPTLSVATTPSEAISFNMYLIRFASRYIAQYHNETFWLCVTLSSHPP